MKRNLTTLIMTALLLTGLIIPCSSMAQGRKATINKYFEKLPLGKPEEGTLQKYRMTAVYTNMDIYGKFTDKTKVVGDYTRGYDGGYSKWNNVYVSVSRDEAAQFDQGKKQDFMENFRYIPSTGMMNEADFKSFPSAIENIYARNLIWDMLSIELFAWRYNDSLHITRPYSLPDIKGEFNMADIGKYNHASIQLCWTGISMINNKLCAVIGYRALNNKVSVEVGNIKTKGTEQYWGNTWISLETREIEFAEIYSATFQEIEVSGMKDKFMTKTIRELTVGRIQ